MALSSVAPTLRGSYELTVISGGSSGGAGRDLGVFGRSETVYAVFIPMADAGGGPDWPMQYALMGSSPAGNSLVTPPMAVKKISATLTTARAMPDPGPVFVAGIIDERGKLQSLRAVRALNASSQAAINALAQWEFLPAELEGRPIATKVLIGARVIQTQELGSKTGN